MTKKKPWNRINLPVYSISSQAGELCNMNICTYVSAVSMQPKRMLVAVYNDTLTLELVDKNPHFVLQLLNKDQYRLVDLLGKKSGRSIDKISRLGKRKLLTRWNGFTILNQALAVMELKAVQHFSGGDHQVFVCDMLAYKNLADGDALTLDDLRAHRLIRI